MTLPVGSADVGIKAMTDEQIERPPPIRQGTKSGKPVGRPRVDALRRKGRARNHALGKPLGLLLVRRRGRLLVPSSGSGNSRPLRGALDQASAAWRALSRLIVE